MASLKYTPEQIDWLRTAYQTLWGDELRKTYNKHWGQQRSTKAILATIKRNGIKSPRPRRFQKGRVPSNKGVKGWQAGGNSAKTQFKKGQKSHNWKPVGSTRTCKKDGYLLVKTAEPSTWRQAHVVEWEKHHGKVPAGQTVSFIDNDKTNLSINNLMLISLAQSAVMAKMGLRQVEPEFKNTAVLLADLAMARTKHKKVKQ